MTIQTKEEASAEYDELMEFIDSVAADADGYSDGFIKDRLILGNEQDGYSVDYGSIIYGLTDLHGDPEAMLAVLQRIDSH